MMRLLGCNVYVSEGHNLQLIRRLEALCSQHPKSVVLANTFIDGPYNRTGLTLAAASIPELAATVQSMAQLALSSLDLRTHQARHPRLGVVDHVSCHPIGPEASLQQAAQAAATIGQQLAAEPLRLPVYYYGAAHREHRRLADIRRNLGYFNAASTASNQQPPPAANTSTSNSNSTANCSWSGSIQQLQLRDYPPDEGPMEASPTAGIVTIGAVPWVTNFNVPLYTDDMATARVIARAVSTRGGGLPGVEAMALQHGPGIIEIATNLTAYDWRATANHSHQSSSAAADSSSNPQQGPAEHTLSCFGDGLQGAGPDEVAAAVAYQVQQHGLVHPGRGYVTNKTPPELLSFAAQKLQL